MQGWSQMSCRIKIYIKSIYFRLEIFEFYSKFDSVFLWNLLSLNFSGKVTAGYSVCYTNRLFFKELVKISKNTLLLRINVLHSIITLSSYQHFQLIQTLQLNLLCLFFLAKSTQIQNS